MLAGSVAQQRVALKLHRKPKSGEVSNERKSAKTLKITEFLNDDGGRASSSHIISVSPNLAPESRRGGARNRADRESDCLTASQLDNLMAAAKHADAIGLPLNRMITIHWQRAGLALAEMAKASGRYIDLVTKAIKRRGSAIAWLWVHEGGEKEGGHCHMLAHVPKKLVDYVTSRQKRWLGLITGQPYRKGVILSRPIGGRLGLEDCSPSLHGENHGVAVGYILKGAKCATLADFGISRHHPGGRIVGKRCGTSQNIGAKARSDFQDAIEAKVNLYQ